MSFCRKVSSVMLLVISTSGLQAEVTSSAVSGFVSEHSLILAVSPARAYDAFVNEVAAWWDAEHSYTGEAQNFSIDATAGGCFCEIGPDIQVEHMRVINAQSGRSIVMQGGLGPLANMAVNGSMRFVFLPHEAGSELKYVYSVGGYVPGGLAGIAEPVDLVQLGQLKRLQLYLKTGEALNQTSALDQEG